MREHGLVAAKILLSLTGAAVCVSGSVFAIEATRDLQASKGQLAGVVAKLDLELDEVHRLTLEAGLTAMEARKASAKESAYLDTWNAGLGQTLSNINAVLAASRKTVAQTGADETALVQSSTDALGSIQRLIAGLAPVEASSAVELDALKQSTMDLDAVIADPNIRKIIASSQTTSDNAAVISTDARRVIEKYAHPSKKKLGFWGSIYAAGKVISHLSPPLF